MEPDPDGTMESRTLEMQPSSYAGSEGPPDTSEVAYTPMNSAAQEEDVRRKTIIYEITFLPGERDTSHNAAEAAYVDIVDQATSHTGFPVDVWGCTMYVLALHVGDVARGRITEDAMYRIPMVGVCYICNSFLQCGLLYWIITTITLPTVSFAQDNYRIFHASAFTDGVFDADGFEGLGDMRMGICELVLPSYFFLGSILFLWTANCAVEIRSITRWHRLSMSLPWLPEGIEPHHVVCGIVDGTGHFEKNKGLLCCWTTTTLVLTYLLVFIPKLCISVTLLFCGSLWLVSSTSFSDLILNSLALVFVIKVDELIFSSFLPARLAARVESMALAVNPGEDDLSEEQKEFKDLKAAYQRSSVFLVLCFLYVVAFIMLQPVLPHFEWDVHQACGKFLKEENQPFCMPWHDSSACFPFGGEVGGGAAGHRSGKGVR